MPDAPSSLDLTLTPDLMRLIKEHKVRSSFSTARLQEFGKDIEDELIKILHWDNGLNHSVILTTSGHEDQMGRRSCHKTLALSYLVHIGSKTSNYPENNEVTDPGLRTGGVDPTSSEQLVHFNGSSHTPGSTPSQTARDTDRSKTVPLHERKTTALHSLRALAQAVFENSQTNEDLDKPLKQSIFDHITFAEAFKRQLAAASKYFDELDAKSETEGLTVEQRSELIQDHVRSIKKSRWLWDLEGDKLDRAQSTDR